MKTLLRRVLVPILCLALLLVPVPGAFAAEPDSMHYDSQTIVGFDTSDFSQTLDLDHKYALIRLREWLPAELTLYLGGTVAYETGEDGVRSITAISGYTEQRVAVEWACLENYDEELDVFHFVPVPDGYTLADGLSLPVIRVNILGELTIPDLPEMPVVPPSLSVSDQAVFESSQDPGISYFNAYAEDMLPAVRNQGSYGACWAFAAIAAIEADLIHDGAANTGIDLSELHLAYFSYHNYFDEKGCNEGDTIVPPGNYLDAGGSPRVAASPLSNMVGPVPESVVPYSLGYDYIPDPVSRGERDFGAAQITGVYSVNPQNINAAKNAILDHGAVSTFVNIYDSRSDSRYYYSADNNSFYNPSYKKTNHVITLVGWDDSFSRSNFRREPLPEKDGAWLVRNSWGEQGYGFGGYFWMSYYDKSIPWEGYAFDAQPWQYDHCYSYASIPTSYYYYDLSGSAVFSQDFQVDGGEEIRAIGFNNRTANSTVSFTVTCGSDSVTASQYCEYEGYYLIPLPEALPIALQSEVTASFTYPGASSSAVYCENEYSFCGTRFNAACKSGGLRQDGSLLGGGRDGFIKLFTDNAAESAEPDLILPEDLRVIGAEAFSGGSFRYAQLSEKVTAIGEKAFCNCPNLRYVYIPEATGSISADAFSGTYNLTILGKRGSYAETYAQDRGFRFTPIVK